MSSPRERLQQALEGMPDDADVDYIRSVVEVALLPEEPPNLGTIVAVGTGEDFEVFIRDDRSTMRWRRVMSSGAYHESWKYICSIGTPVELRPGVSLDVTDRMVERASAFALDASLSIPKSALRDLIHAALNGGAR